MMKKLIGALLCILILSQSHAQNIIVNKDIEYQTIEGFGGFGGFKPWWEPAPYHDAKYLTTTIDDLGVTIFRTQIFWDGEPVNDNDDPNTFNMSGFNFGPTSDNGKQFPFITDLAAKGAKLIATVWTPPVWMKLRDEANRIPDECYNCWQCPKGSAGTEMCGGRLNPEHYDEFAEYLVAYVKTLKEQTGVDLYGISIQNEPYFANPFESNVVMPDEYADILRVVGERFDAEGLQTRFFGPEHMAEWSWGWQEKYVQETLGDPAVKPHLDIYAVHGYVDGVAADYGSAEGWTSLHNNITVAHGKQLWMTETSDFDRTGYDLAFEMARSLYLALKFGHISAWVYWSIHDALYKNNQLTPLGYAFKNYYRYIRPGAIRIEATSDDDAVLTLAFRHSVTNDVTLILINSGSQSRSMNLNIPFDHNPFTLYRTSATENCKEIGVMNSNSVILTGRSITTLTTIAGSGVVGVQKKSGEMLVNIFPNPSQGKIKIEFAEAGNHVVTISDATGRIVETQTTRQAGLVFDTHAWKRGIYFIRVTSGLKHSTHKLLLE